MNKKSIAGIVGLVAALAFASSAMAATFSTNLKLGSTGSDVKNLQIALNADPFTQVAAAGAGAPGMESSYFGVKTKAAVIKFQNKYASDILAPVGLTAGTGFVGVSTRAKLNAMSGVTTTTTTTTTTNAGCIAGAAFSSTTGQPCGTVVSTSGPVSVALSASQPAGGVITGQAGAVLANLTFTGNGTVSSVTLNRGGVSDQNTLTNVYLYDGATRLTDGYTFNNAGVITMNNVNLSVNGSRSITIKGDIVADGTKAGQTISIVLSSITTASGTSATTVVGSMLSVVNGSGLLATGNFTSAVTPSSASTINAGSFNQSLWSSTLNIGTRAVFLKGMTVKMVGSAPSNALSNVQLFVDGVSAGSASINTNSQYVFDLSATPSMVNTGSHIIDVRGDVVAGAYRNFYLSLENGADLMLTDSQVAGGSVSLTPTYSNNPISNLSAALISIAQGTLTVNQDTSFNNVTTLVGGATNVQMAAFKFTSYGEDVKVNTLAFTPSITGMTPATTKLVNVGLYVNGGQVGSTQTATNATTLTFSSLGSNLTIPAGTSVTVEIRGDVVNENGAPYTAGTILFSVVSNATGAQGIGSGQLSAVSAATGQSRNVSSVNVTFAQTTGWATSTSSPNQVEKKIGTFTVQAGSSEGVIVSNIAVGLSGTMLDNKQITNIKIKDGSTIVGTPVGSPTGANNFSVTLPVGVSGTKVLDVYADIGSSAATYFVIPTMAITYRGTTSYVNTTSSAIIGAAIGADVATIGAGNVTFSNGLSMTQQAVTGPSTGLAIGTFNVTVSNAVAGAVLKELYFSVGNGISSITVNGNTASVVGGYATTTNVNITVPADASGASIPVTVALVCMGTANGCVANSPVTDAVTLKGIQYSNGATTVSLVGLAGKVTNNVIIYASKPSLSVNTTQQSGLVIGAENKIGEVTITASSNGQIKINDLAFNIATSGMTTAALSGARIADGNTTIPGSSIKSGCIAPGACVMTFGASPSGYAIAAGSSKTFSLFATVAGTPTASTVVSVSSSVTPATLSWDDSVGGATVQAGTNIYNFPTGSYSVKQ